MWPTTPDTDEQPLTPEKWCLRKYCLLGGSGGQEGREGQGGQFAWEL